MKSKRFSSDAVCHFFNFIPGSLFLVVAISFTHCLCVSCYTDMNSYFLAFVLSASFSFFFSLFRHRLQGPSPVHYDGGGDGSHHVRDQGLP